MSRNDKEKGTSRFNPFSWMTRDGAGVPDDEPPILDNPGIKNYFKLLWRKLNQIISINVMMLACNFPIFFALAVMSGYFSIHSTAPTYSIFAQINGAAMHTPDAYTSALLGTFSAQSEITVLSTVDYVFLGLTCLVFLTFGCVMVGSVYLLRNMVREEHIFFFQDFWYSIKRNYKQAIVYGIIDLLIMLLIVYDVIFFNINYGNSLMTSMMFFMSLVLAVLYTVMRIYIYIMMITFDLSLLKLFKNALIFTVLGIKRNAVAILLIAAVGVISFGMLGIYMPIGVLIPFVILFSLITYTGVYYAYPVISKYMIEPYYNKDGTAKSAADSNNDDEEYDDDQDEEAAEVSGELEDAVTSDACEEN